MAVPEWVLVGVDHGMTKPAAIVWMSAGQVVRVCYPDAEDETNTGGDGTPDRLEPRAANAARDQAEEEGEARETLDGSAIEWRNGSGS